MAESLTLNPGVGGEVIRVLDDGTYLWPAGITAFATSVADPDVVAIVTPTTGLPVRLADGSGYLATLPVSLASVPSHAVTGPLTDAELRATAVPVSTASLPLPTGASTAAKQPAIGTAGTASADVLTVQGAAGMTPVLVNGSGVTQPVSDAGGSLTVDNAGTFAVQAAQSGSWTVALGATDNAVLDDIAASLAGSLTVDDGGSSLTVDGTVTANAGAGTFAVSAASLPLPAGAATLAEQQSQTTQLTRLGLKYLDYDTGAGTDSAVAFGILLPGNGGSVVGGTSSNPIRTDPTGSTTQPVSGTVTANLGTIGDAATEASLAALNAKVTAVNTGAVVVSTLPALPAGTNNIGDVDVLSLPAIPTGSNTIGAVNLAQYTPVTGRLPVDGSGVTQPVSGTVTAELSATDNAVLDAIAASLAGTLTVTGGGGGTEYTEGATDASITGSAILWEDTGDTLRAVSAAKPLPIGDAGGSLTVDNGGTFAVQAAQSGTWTVTGAGGSFPVTDSGGSLTVDNADLTAAAGSLNVMDDWDESDRAKVNPIVGQAGVQGGSGAVSAITQRVVLATDVALPTGANVIGGVTQSGTWTVTGTGGTFPVTDSGGSLTVDAPVGTPVFVRLSDGSSAISTLPVSLASVPSHAVTNAGTFAVQAAQSGTWNVGTVTTVTTLTGGGIAHDSADSGNPVKVGARAVNAVQTLVANNDRSDLTTDLSGRLQVGFGPRELTTHATTTITASTSETTVLAAGAAGVFHDVTTVMVANTSGTAVRVDFKDATSGTVRFSIYAPAGQTVGFSTPGDPAPQASAANNWTATCSASVTDVRIYIKARKTQ